MSYSLTKSQWGNWRIIKNNYVAVSKLRAAEVGAQHAKDLELNLGILGEG